MSVPCLTYPSGIFLLPRCHLLSAVHISETDLYTENLHSFPGVIWKILVNLALVHIACTQLDLGLHSYLLLILNYNKLVNLALQSYLHFKQDHSIL
jgi:hypothetical protein